MCTSVWLSYKGIQIRRKDELGFQVEIVEIFHLKPYNKLGGLSRFLFGVLSTKNLQVFQVCNTDSVLTFVHSENLPKVTYTVTSSDLIQIVHSSRSPKADLRSARLWVSIAKPFSVSSANLHKLTCNRLSSHLDELS